MPTCQVPANNCDLSDGPTEPRPPQTEDDLRRLRRAVHEAEQLREKEKREKKVEQLEKTTHELDAPIRMGKHSFSRFKIGERKKSASRPWVIECCDGSIDNGPPVARYLLKEEDMTPDLVACRLIRTLNYLWRTADIRLDDDLRAADGTRCCRPVQALEYNVYTVGREAGFVEMVEDAETLAELKRQGAKKERVLEYLEWEPERVRQLASSTVGYLVSVYVLGVRDGHFDNVMLRRDGTLFRIDFSFLCNTSPVSKWIDIDTPLVCLPRAVKVAIDACGLWDRVCHTCSRCIDYLHAVAIDAQQAPAAQRASDTAIPENISRHLRPVLQKAGHASGHDFLSFLAQQTSSKFDRTLPTIDASIWKTIKCRLHELGYKSLWHSARWFGRWLQRLRT
eukprot:TRINITY_DN28835_c0_g1_i1.p1 TRINITY_DN28835_c0_g1~~TRINITY_DN28835_c0_g1_i1.p1  ORF type:complete len:394 (-),score=51.44 TRINITY_DN28835_c0_g1_i1:367-1548(-)